MAIPSGVTNGRWDEVRGALYTLQGWMQEDVNRSVQIACEYHDRMTTDLIVFYANPQDALDWVDNKFMYCQALWYEQPLFPLLTVSFTDLTVEQQPIDPPPPPVEPPVDPPEDPPILPPDPSGLPGNLSTDSFASARDSILAAQQWLDGDPNRRVKITVTNEADPLDPNPHVFYDPQGALGWVSGVQTYANSSSPPASVMLILSFEDITGQTIPPENPPTLKELPASLQSIATGSAAALTTFANSLYNWTITDGTSCVTASCSLNPEQEGFANTFSAPNMNSIASWVSGAASYMETVPNLMASINVSVVPCGEA
jgi:hypothetical protein